MKFENEWGFNSTKIFVPICLWEWLNFFFFLSLSKQAQGRLPARILFSLHFTSFSPWVLLPHSEPFVSHQCWSLLSRALFPFAWGCFAPSLGRGHSTARVKLQSLSSAQVGWEQCTSSKLKSETNLKSKECIQIVSSFKMFTHFSRDDLLLFNPLNHAET